jgi:RNA polymerase sigma-70 factor (ECF subfamily)
MPSPDAIFEEQRPQLMRLAYRMLGSLADADDVLQEAYLRWTREPRGDVESARSYLATIVTRLCIDQRRALETRKESYVGPWLPEPLVESAVAPAEVDTRLEVAESISLGFLVVLESLSPVERAAYLLRRVFDYDYPEIAAILGKSEPNCRQLVSRAEDHVRARRPRFETDAGEAERITVAFLQACSSGDVNGLVQLLAADAVAYSDGGGKALAARVPIQGAERIANFFVTIVKKAPAGLELRGVRVNGRPGVMTLRDGRVTSVLTLDIRDGRIASCFVIVNPDKLARVAI